MNLNNINQDVIDPQITQIFTDMKKNFLSE
jgi:hypothetical protein